MSIAMKPRRRSAATTLDLPVPDIPVSSTRIILSFRHCVSDACRFASSANAGSLRFVAAARPAGRRAGHALTLQFGPGARIIAIRFRA
jgi:hypothetical protein